MKKLSLFFTQKNASHLVSFLLVVGIVSGVVSKTEGKQLARWWASVEKQWVTVSEDSTSSAMRQETEEPGQVLADERERVVIEGVVDGDTIILEGGQRLRYIGIDTPETKHPTKPAECFGQQASEKNAELVTGKEVELEKDVNDTDRYGRLLRYVYLDGVMVNEILVREGYAQAVSFPPDIKYQEQLQQAEAAARQAGRGLWSSSCTITVSK